MKTASTQVQYRLRQMAITHIMVAIQKILHCHMQHAARKGLISLSRARNGGRWWRWPHQSSMFLSRMRFNLLTFEELNSLAPSPCSKLKCPKKLFANPHILLHKWNQFQIYFHIITRKGEEKRKQNAFWPFRRTPHVSRRLEGAHRGGQIGEVSWSDCRPRQSLRPWLG